MRRILVAVLLCAGCTGEAPQRVAVPAATALAPQARTAGEFAEAACTRLRLVGQGVQADGDAATVRTELAAARALAAEATRRDARWAALSGGVAALDEALAEDDPAAAGLGLEVALRACPGS